jgi:hypothetical protein
MDNASLFSYCDKWFVLMHESLYEEDPSMIGFRDVNEWSSIFEEALIVYYQFGTMRIKGIYEVVETRKRIKPSFGTASGLFVERNALQYQCRLKHIHALDVSFGTDRAENLKFYANINNKVRWDRRRVFDIDDEDLQYILSLG